MILTQKLPNTSFSQHPCLRHTQPFVFTESRLVLSSLLQGALQSGQELAKEKEGGIEFLPECWETLDLYLVKPS